MKISAIIPLFKPDPERLRELLKVLREQTMIPDEIILVETRGAEPTQKGLNADGARRVFVRREDFNHGGTRNFAARECSGDVIVFLTQDALPADREMIERLVSPLKDPRTPAAYGRHIPRPGAKPTERFARLFNYPEESLVKDAHHKPSLGIKAVFFSNVCSAVRRKEWEEVGGFPEDIIMSEDMVLAARLIQRGYFVAYASKARVFHSHDYTLSRQFQRYFDIGAMLKRYSKPLGIPAPEGEGLRFLREQLAYLAGSGNRRWIPYALFEDAAKFWGYRLGRFSPCLPRWLNARLGLHKNYWTTGSGINGELEGDDF